MKVFYSNVSGIRITTVLNKLVRQSVSGKYKNFTFGIICHCDDAGLVVGPGEVVALFSLSKIFFYYNIPKDSVVNNLKTSNASHCTEIRIYGLKETKFPICHHYLLQGD